MAWARCCGGGTVTPEYITTGLNIYSNRCVILDGGYYISGSTVYVDITIRVNFDYSGFCLYITGWPQSSTPSSGQTVILTPTFNKCVMYQNGDPSLGTVFGHPDGTTIVVGESLHFIGHYQMQTT